MFLQMVAAIHFYTGNMRELSDRFCITQGLFYYMIPEMSYILLPVSFFRFVLAVNINKLKSGFFIQIKTDRNTGQRKQKEIVRWQFKIISLLSKWWVNLLIVLTFGSIWFLIQMIVLGVNIFLCNDHIITTYHITFLVFYYFLKKDNHHHMLDTSHFHIFL